MDRAGEMNPFDDDIKALHRTAEEGGGGAQAEIEEAIGRLRRAGDPSRVAWALPALARALAFNERFDEADAAAKEALVYFRIHGCVPGQALALNAQAVGFTLKGMPARTLELAGRAMVLARTTGDLELCLRVANTLGGGLIDIGRFEDAVDALEEGLSAARALPEQTITNRVRANLACALARWAMQAHDAGEPEARWRPHAVRVTEIAPLVMAQWRRQGLMGLLEPVTDELASAFVLLGDVEQAHALLDEGERMRVPGARLYSIAYVYCVRARAWLRANDPARALEAIAQGRAIADVRVKSVHMAELARLESVAHEIRGDLKAALDAYKRFHSLRERAVVGQVQRLQLEARHDPLTGLANRRRFDEFVVGMLPRASVDRPMSLLLIDLDHFKTINDRYSHLVGDAALRWVALQMEGVCRQNDLPVRLGGDEFAIVLEAPLEIARQVAERLRTAVAAHATELPREVKVGLSVGIAEATAPCEPQHLLARADGALYAAKTAGRDRASIAA